MLEVDLHVCPYCYCVSAVDEAEQIRGWDEYEAWEAEHCEHGVPPGKHCPDCEGDWP